MNLIDKISKIKIVLADIDGVLTDGGLYYSSDGLQMKKFNVKDGMGAVMLKEKGYKVGIISSDKSDIAQARANRLKLDFVFYGVENKIKIIEEICKSENVTKDEIAYMGDDEIDLEVLTNVGLSACPSDAIKSVRDCVIFISSKQGGHGAFRELADLIIKNRIN
ncbi:MAG: HAD-IA family hydrolase [Bacteroidetes bacterium]|nr:HAD-IA family hydrolase [Bacteroidota bacterium]